MAEEKIAERIDANLLNIDINELHTISKDDYEKKFETLRSKKHTANLSSKNILLLVHRHFIFRALLDELALKKTFKPDIIFVDYLNICSSARIKPGGNVNSYTYIKSIAEDFVVLLLRIICPLFCYTNDKKWFYKF
jgi:hypothetical protein